MSLGWTADSLSCSIEVVLPENSLRAIHTATHNLRKLELSLENFMS